MNKMTLAQKKSLETLVEAGAKVVSVAYNPKKSSAPTVVGTEFYREATADLVEVIYTSA